MTPATADAQIAAVAPPRCSSWRAFEVSFEPDPACVGRIRRITAAFLALWNVRGRLAEDIVLVVSELVTNALVHGKGSVRLRVHHLRNELRIEVTDGSSAPAKRRPVNDDDASGRGLFLVSVLTRTWGTSDDGRTTWCLVRAPARRL